MHEECAIGTDAAILNNYSSLIEGKWNQFTALLLFIQFCFFHTADGAVGRAAAFGVDSRVLHVRILAVVVTSIHLYATVLSGVQADGQESTGSFSQRKCNKKTQI